MSKLEELGHVLGHHSYDQAVALPLLESVSEEQDELRHKLQEALGEIVDLRASLIAMREELRQLRFGEQKSLREVVVDCRTVLGIKPGTGLTETIKSLLAELERVRANEAVGLTRTPR